MDQMQQPAVLQGTALSTNKRQRDSRESQRNPSLKPSPDTRPRNALSEPHHFSLDSSAGKSVIVAASNIPLRPIQPDVPEHRPLGESFASKAVLSQSLHATPLNQSQPEPTTNATKRPASLSCLQPERKRRSSGTLDSKLFQLEDDPPKGIPQRPYNPHSINRTKTMPSMENQHLSSKDVSPIQKTGATATTCEQQGKRTTSDPDQNNPQKLASVLSARDPRLTLAQSHELRKASDKLEQEFPARPSKRGSIPSVGEGPSHHRHSGPVETPTQPSSGGNNVPSYISTSQMQKPRQQQQSSTSEVLPLKGAPAAAAVASVLAVVIRPRAGESLCHRDINQSAQLQAQPRPDQPTPVLRDLTHSYRVSACRVPPVPKVLSEYWRLVTGDRKCVALCTGMNSAQRSWAWTASLHAGFNQRMECSIPPCVMAEVEGKFYLGWHVLRDGTLMLLLSEQDSKQLTIVECKVRICAQVGFWV